VAVVQYTFTHKQYTEQHNQQQNNTNNKQNNTNNKSGRVLAVPSLLPCFTLAFDLQLRKKHGKTSVRVAEEIQSINIIKTPTHYKTHTHTLTKQLKTIRVQIKTNTVQDIPNEIVTI
jgi:hypothetical protein